MKKQNKNPRQKVVDEVRELIERDWFSANVNIKIQFNLGWVSAKDPEIYTYVIDEMDANRCIEKTVAYKKWHERIKKVSRQADALAKEEGKDKTVYFASILDDANYFDDVK